MVTVATTGAHGCRTLDSRFTDATAQYSVLLYSCKQWTETVTESSLCVGIQPSPEPSNDSEGRVKKSAVPELQCGAVGRAAGGRVYGAVADSNGNMRVGRGEAAP